MSEEKENLQRQADRSKPTGKHSVMSYMAILFLAAFILLLLAYFMQHRSNEAAIDGLRDSVSAIQTAQEVYEENVTLREQVSDLEKQIEAMESEIAGLERSNSLLIDERDTLSLTAQAMDWFWQVNEAYVRGRTTTARGLIESMTSAGLVEYLPRESVTNNERFSPYDRFQEIREALY